MAGALPVGIDLGTTFSCVSVYRNGRTEIIPNKDGARLIPSVVYFDPKTGRASVGSTAEYLIPQCTSNGILDAKRLIGRKYDDEFISRYTKSKQTLFSMVRAPDNRAAFEVEISGKKVIKMPEEVSAEVLKYLKDMASDYLNNTVSEAVISIPAYFSNAQRKATKRAAELAGLKVLKLVTEPTAAAIHYVSDKQKHNANILVFDFGGGTLDVSVIKIMDKTFVVKAVYGDTLLGGRNFDEILFDYFYKDFLSKHDPNMENKRFKRRLSNMCINLKKKLSTKREIVLDIDRYDGKDSNYFLSMTREKFEELSKDIFQRCLNVVKLCLNDSDLSKEDIDDVVLVGGSTRIPKIREMLETFFDGKRLKLDLNPDEAVAAGASVQAALLKEKSVELEKYLITEVTPLSLGIKTKSNYMTVYIPKNSSLPTIARRNVITATNDQTEMDIEIYEGERKNTTYNNKLGKFNISGLPPNRAGHIEVNISFELDEDGLLTVQAFEKSTEVSNKLTVTMGQFRLSETAIQRALEDAERNRREDDTFEKFNRARCNYDQRCSQILYDINKISSDDERNFVQKSCSDFLEFSKSLYFTRIDDLEGRFANLVKSVDGILKENKMLEIQYLRISSSDIWERRPNNPNLRQALVVRNTRQHKVEE